MRRRTRDASTERREKYLERVRGWTERWGQNGAGGLAAQLARLEAGEPVVVQGWEFVEGPPIESWEDYVLEPDGALVPVEAIHEDESAKVKTVVNYQRPDGSLVR